MEHIFCEVQLCIEISLLREFCEFSNFLPGWAPSTFGGGDAAASSISPQLTSLPQDSDAPAERQAGEQAGEQLKRSDGPVGLVGLRVSPRHPMLVELHAEPASSLGVAAT